MFIELTESTVELCEEPFIVQTCDNFTGIKNSQIRSIYVENVEMILLFCASAKKKFL